MNIRDIYVHDMSKNERINLKFKNDEIIRFLNIHFMYIVLNWHFERHVFIFQTMMRFTFTGKNIK